MGDRARALLDRRHRARDRRLQRPRPRDRRGQLGLGGPEDRRAIARGDHRRREEQVVADPDRHAVRLELDPQRAPERLDPGLGRAVGAEARRRAARAAAEEISSTCPRRASTCGSAAPHRAPDAEQVDVDRLLDRLRRDQPQRPAGGDAGVGDRDVDAAEARREVVDRGGQPRRVAHVGDRGLGARADRAATASSGADRRRSARGACPGRRAGARARRRCRTRRR